MRCSRVEWDTVARRSFTRKLNPQDVEVCLVSAGLERKSGTAKEEASSLSTHPQAIHPMSPHLLILQSWPKEKAPGLVKAGSCEIPKAPEGTGKEIQTGRASREGTVRDEEKDTGGTFSAVFSRFHPLLKGQGQWAE